MPRNIRICESAHDALQECMRGVCMAFVCSWKVALMMGCGAMIEAWYILDVAPH